MLEIVDFSIKHFFEEILKQNLKKANDIGGELYGSSIVLNSKIQGDFVFYLFFPKEGDDIF